MNLEGTVHYLHHINVFLVLAVVLVTIFRFLKLSPVLGYFVAGATINKFCAFDKGIDIFAEFGIVFLLFVIGLELTFERLKSMRKHVFGFGSLQVLITSLVLGALYYVYDPHVTQAFIIGTAFALSSTAIVLQVLHESGRQTTQVGRLSLSVLLLQDLAVIPLLVLIPFLDSSVNNFDFFKVLWLSIAKGVIVLFFIFFIGRKLLRPFFRLIVGLKSQELFVATTLLVMMGLAYLTEKFGLSMALGAFVAGLLVAETEYRYEVEQVVTPFKSLLLGLFFMSVGMSINFDTLVTSAPEIFVGTLVLLSIKSLIIFMLCRLFSFHAAAAIHAGLLLSQGGEFAFILFGLAHNQALLSTELMEKLLMVVSITMAITPLLSIIANKVADLISKDIQQKKEFISDDTSDLRDHIVIIGFNETGKAVAKLLSTTTIYYLACDINPAIVDQAKKHGYAVHRGDATNQDIYTLLNVQRARAIVVAMNNKVTLRRVLRVIQAHFPNKQLIVSLDSFAHEIPLKLTVDHFFVSYIETACEIVQQILIENADYSVEEAQSILHRIRGNEYATLKELINIRKKALKSDASK